MHPEHGMNKEKKQFHKGQNHFKRALAGILAFAGALPPLPTREVPPCNLEAP